MGPSGLGDSDTPDEGIKEVKVGPKKKVSSSGWAVNSRRRGMEPSIAGPEGNVSLEWNGLSSRPRMTGSRASATYRPGTTIRPHSQPLAPLCSYSQSGNVGSYIVHSVGPVLPHSFSHCTPAIVFNILSRHNESPLSMKTYTRFPTS